MNTDIAESLNRAIDRHSGGQPVGKLESHDLHSLSARILAPADVVEKLLATGVLRSEGPVHANDETGLHTFNSDLLNEVRRAVLAAIVEQVIEQSDTVDHVGLAAGHALRKHAESFAADGVSTKELSRFPEGLVQLSSYYRDEEEQGSIERAGKVAAVGGLAYGAASLLRGRRRQPGAGLIDQLKAGHAANVGTGRAVAGKLSIGAAKVAAVIGRRFR